MGRSKVIDDEDSLGAVDWREVRLSESPWAPADKNMHSKHPKAWQAKRRKMVRLVSTEVAEVIALATGMHFTMHLSDIGVGGCFIGTLFPFAVDARVRIRLSYGLVDFETEGRVVYSQPKIGMGIAFDELNDVQRFTLTLLA